MLHLKQEIIIFSYYNRILTAKRTNNFKGLSGYISQADIYINIIRKFFMKSFDINNNNKQNMKAISLIKNKAKALVELERKRARPFKPVIISDIDGVLVRGHTPIPLTLQAMEKIHQQKIPFACLTNGGGRVERVKAQNLNKSFNKKLFTEDSMFLNHTPLKPQLIRCGKSSGNLLVSGSLNIISILEDLKISNFITADQMYAIYFNENNKNHSEGQIIFQLHQRPLKRQVCRNQVQKRIGRQLKSFEQQAHLINSIFALNDVSPYETTLTIIHNILKQRSKLKENKPIQYFAAQNDIIWAGGYHKPRIAFGPFNYILEEHCKRHKLDLIQHIYYGKPQLKAFQFVQRIMKKREPNGVFFMMGDNPRADIRGANNIGWYSFLTRTGVHQGEDNDPSDPATFVVDNFHEAVEIIFQASKELNK